MFSHDEGHIIEGFERDMFKKDEVNLTTELFITVVATVIDTIAQKADWYTPLVTAHIF